MKTDSRIDAYIAKAPPFAQPVLVEARQRVQKVCPGVEETIKWRVPFFLFEGKILASMAGFKKHVKVGVWVEMKPTFWDVTSVAELPAAKDFAARLKSALQVIAGAPSARPAKEASGKKASGKKASGKKASGKKAPAKKK